MSDTASADSGATGAVDGGHKDADNGKNAQKDSLGFFGRIALFVRQVIAELKKVTAPTRPQLLNYSAVVIVFVLAVMAFVLLVDFLIGKGTFWVFG